MNIKRLTLSALILAFFSVNTAFATYTDVGPEHKNFSGVSYVELQGGSDGGDIFRPDDKIKKAELFKILFKVFGENIENLRISSTFKDVDKKAWYAPFTELAIKFDLVDTSSKLFEPTKTISRREAMATLYKVYGIAAPKLSNDIKVDLFHDVSKDHPLNSFIQRAVDLEIIQANPQKLFKPYESITRGDFADLLLAFDQWYVNHSFEGHEEISNVYKAEILEDIWMRVLESFYLAPDQQIDKEALFQAMIKGMLQSLDDPYTTFLSSEDASKLGEQLTGEFEGIGVYLFQDEKTKKIYVTDFLEGSNAPEAGLKVGDEIRAVDGVSINGLEYTEVVARIKGPTGTKVELTIFRNNVLYDFQIERRKITVQMESAKILYDDVWYVDINSFTATSFIEVNVLLKDLKSQISDPKAIIIDVRGNGGGFLNSALSIAGHFVQHSEPLISLDYGAFIETINNSGEGEYHGIPLYVLIDKYSASASEILAAALNDEANAILVGQKSFGKGTAQQLVQYWDGSILKFTIAHWLSPNGETIEGLGIAPDIEITGTSTSIDLGLDKIRQLLNKN